MQRFTLAGVPEFEQLLHDIVTDLRRKGRGEGVLVLAGNSEEYPFDLLPINFNVEDHGSHQGPKCAVCDTRRDRRFVFCITCKDGIERGPIGSSCVFTHVLGDESGKRFGLRLKDITESHAHLVEHNKLLKQSGNFFDYCVELGIVWIFDSSEIGRAQLTPRERHSLAKVRSDCRAIPKKLYQKLIKHKIADQPEINSVVVKATPALVEQAPSKTHLGEVVPKVKLNETERTRFILLWRHISQRMGKDAQGIGKLLQENEPLPQWAVLQLRIISDEVEKYLQVAKERQERISKMSAAAPLPTSPKIIPKLTTASILVEACKYLNSLGREDLRRKLVYQPQDWLQKHMGQEVAHFKRQGTFSDVFLLALSRLLEKVK